MPQHGDYNQEQQKLYCGYWMTPDEWLDIHDYAPPTFNSENDEQADDNEQ
jgi:hypothetical protein